MSQTNTPTEPKLCKNGCGFFVSLSVTDRLGCGGRTDGLVGVCKSWEKTRTLGVRGEHHQQMFARLSVDGRPLSHPPGRTTHSQRFQDRRTPNASSLGTPIDTTFRSLSLTLFSSNRGPRVVSHHREATPPATAARNVGTKYNRKITRRMHASRLWRQRWHRRRR